MREFFDRKRRYVALVLAVVMALMSPLSSVAQTTSDEGSFNLLEALMPERELLTEQTVTAGEVPAYPASVNEEKAEEDSGYVNLASGSETVNLASDSVSGGEEYFAHSEPIDGVIVTVKAAAGVLPPDAKLTVEKASENDAEYIDAAIENTKLTEENTEENSADDYRLALDITFTDENGNEIEPDGEVELKFILQDMEKPLSNIKVYHIIDSDAEMQKNAEELDELIKKIESEEIEEEDFEFPDGPVYDNIGAGDDFDKEQYIPEIDEEKTTQENMSELKETPYVAESLELSLEDIKSEKKDEKPITEVTVITDSFSTYTLVGTTGESAANVIVTLIDGTKEYFSDPQKAFDAVRNDSKYDNSTISLDKDYTGNYELSWSSNRIRLDLGDHSLTARDSGSRVFESYASIELLSGTLHGDVFLQSDYGLTVPENSTVKIDGKVHIGGHPELEPQKSRIVVKGGYYSKPQKYWFVNDENYGMYFTAEEGLRDEFPYTIKQKSEPVFSVPVPNDGTVVYADRLEDAIYSLNRMSYTNPARITMIGDNVTENSLIIKNPVTFAFADESVDKHYSGDITVSDGGELYVENGKYDTVFSTSGDGKIQISGGYFKNVPSYTAPGYAAFINPDSTSEYKYIVKENKESEAYVEKSGTGGKIYYALLSEAVNAAEAGDVVTLLKDGITITRGTYADAESVFFNKDITLDLNNKTLSVHSDGKIFVESNITIKNGTLGFAGYGISENHNAMFRFENTNYGSITFTNVNVEGYCIADTSDSSLTFDLTINNTEENTVTAHTLLATKKGSNAKLTLNGGKYNLDIWMNENGDSNHYTAMVEDGDFTIGSWKGSLPSEAKTARTIIKTGNFNINPDQDFTGIDESVRDVNGFIKNWTDAQTGTNAYQYSVGPIADCEAYVFGTNYDYKIYYRTIGTAFSDVHTTKTVTLCKDVNLSETVAANCADGGTITLDLNGKAINCLDTDSKYSVAENTTLKIISSIKGGSIHNFGTIYPPSGSKGGTIIFDGANVKGYLGITKYKTEIKSGKWWIDGASRPTPGEPEQGEFKISGGKFRYNTWDDKDLLKSGCYFFNNPDDDKNDYPYLVDKGYTVSFNLNGHGGEIAPVKARAGYKLAAPATPSDESYSFDGWFTENGISSGIWGDQWNFDKNTVTKDTKLYAKWTETVASLKKQGESTVVYYASLSKAMYAAGDGSTVTLLKNITIPDENKLLWKSSNSITVTLDLNGKTITGNYAGPLLDIENIKLSIIDSSVEGSGENAGTIINESANSSAYVMNLVHPADGWGDLTISAGNYIGYNGIEFQYYDIDLSNLNITAQRNALEDTQNIAENIAISSGKFKGSIIVRHDFKESYGKITGGLFTHKLDSRLYAGNSAPHRQFRSGDADYPYTVDKTENAAAENYSDTDKNIEGLGYYSLSQALSDASENAKIRVLKPVTSDTEISRSNIEITGDIEVKDSALLEIKAGKYDGVLSKAESAGINITGGLFKITPNASHIADGYGVQNNPDTASDYKYTIVKIAEAEAYVSIPGSDIRIYYPKMTDAIYGAEAGSTVYQIVQETLISPLDKDVLASGIVLNGNTMRIKEASTLSLGKDVRISNGTITGGSSGISLLAVKGKTIFEDINFIADTPIYWGSENADVEIHGGVHKINRFISGTSGYWKEDKPVLSIYYGQFALNNWFFTGYPENDYVHIQLYGGDYSISPDAQSTHDVIRIGEGRGIVKNAADAKYPWSVATLSEADCEAKLPKEHCIYEKEEDAGIYYRTIGAALSDVHTTKTVTLCKDVTLKEAVKADCTNGGIITLDLNGKQLSFDSTEHSVSAADDTELSFINGTVHNFYHPIGSTERGVISFGEGIDFSGRFDVRNGNVRITSGRWKQVEITIDPPYDLNISGGKFNTKLSEYLATGCYFFENPDDDKNDYRYLVDKGYTVSFDLNGHGGEIAPVKARAGHTLAAPATPSDVSYTFDGWFTENGVSSGIWGNQWNFNTNTVTKDTKLYAKWTETVASVTTGQNTYYYGSLNEALDSDKLADGSLVRLYRDSSISSNEKKRNLNNNMTIDLGGNTITFGGKADMDMKVADGKHVTIQNGTVKGYVDGISLFLVGEDATLTIKDATVSDVSVLANLTDLRAQLILENGDYSMDKYALSNVSDNKKVIINGGNHKVKERSASDTYWNYLDVEINGGNFNLSPDYSWTDHSGYRHYYYIGSGKGIIKNTGNSEYPWSVAAISEASCEARIPKEYCKYQTEADAGIYYLSAIDAVREAKQGTTLTVLKDAVLSNESEDITFSGTIRVASGVLTITGGKYDGVLSKDESARINITGGAFKNAPKKEYIEEGYGVKVTGEEYPYIVLPATDIDGEAIIHDVSKDVEYYVDTLKNAIASPVLEDGDSITLRRNATIDNTSCFDKSITLNLAGNTLNGVGDTFDIPVKASVSIINGKVIQNTDKDDDLSFFKVYAGGNLSFDDVDLDASSVVIFWDGENGDTSPSELYIHGGNHKIKYIASSVYHNQNIQGKAVIDGGYYPSLTDWRFKGDKSGFKDYLHVDLEIRGGSFNLNPDYEWKDNNGKGTVRRITIASGKGIIRNIGNSEYPWSVATLSEADCEAKLPKEHCKYQTEADAGIYYRTIGTALNDVHETKTVTLCKDATLEESVTISCPDEGKTITLDLNGKKLTSSGNQTISVAENTIFEITSSNENGTFTNFTTGGSAGGKIIFEKVNVEGSVRLLDCETEIKSGKWKISTMSLPSIGSGKLRISGGKFNTKLSEYLATGCYFFENPDDDKNDYQYLVDQGYTVSFALNGHGSDIDPMTARAGHTITAPATPSETGYIFDGWFKESGCENRWNFDTDPVESDMTLYAKWAEPAAAIINGSQDAVYYRTAEEAFAAAQDGDTVKLLKPFGVTKALAINHRIILDLNGQQLTFSSRDNGISLASGKTLEITSSNGEGNLVNFYAIRPGQLDVTDGTIRFKDGVAFNGDIATDYKTYIESGKWEINSIEYASEGQIQISGGYFKNAPMAAYIADGYAVFNNPDRDSLYKYLVKGIEDVEAYVEKSGTDVKIYYDYLSDALDNVSEAGPADTVVLLKNLTVRKEGYDKDGTAVHEAIKFSRDVILDLNGKTLIIGGQRDTGHRERIGDIPVSSIVEIKNGCITSTMSAKDESGKYPYAFSMFQLQNGAQISFASVSIAGYCPVDFSSDLSALTGVAFRNSNVDACSLVTGQIKDRNLAELEVEGGTYELESWFFTHYTGHTNINRKINSGQFKLGEWGTPAGSTSYGTTTVLSADFNLDPDDARITIADGSSIVKNYPDNHDSEYAPYQYTVGSAEECEAYVPGAVPADNPKNNIYYRTIGTALNDVHETKTVTLCKDATLEESVTISCPDEGKTITLDLNGKKLTSSGNQTISVAENTIFEITSSNENGTFTNFTTGGSAGGKIIFEKVNVEGSVRLLDCETEIKSGKWKISTMSLPSIGSGKLRISGGKFNTKLSEYLATGCYFFENPDDDKNDYQYLVDQGYTVSFALNGHGGEIAPVTARAEHTLAAPATPSDVSYSFDGWFTENGASSGIWGDQWDFDTDKVTEDTTLYAKWTIKKYTVSFDMQGHGAQITSQSVEHGGKITKPADPTAEGYLFDGWFTKDGTGSDWGDQWNFEKGTVTADITLHAKWTEAEASLKKQGESTAVYFASLSEAVNTASDGSTVYVLKDGIVVGGDSATGEQLNLDKTFIIDLNGKTLVSRFSRVGGQNKTITIQNGTLRSSGGDNDAGLFWLNDYNTSLVLKNVNTYGDRIAALSCDWDVLTIDGGFHKGHTIISANGNGSNQKIRISSGDFELDTWMYDDDNTHNNYTADVTGGNFKLESWKGKSSADSNCKINIEGGNYNLSPDQTFATIKTGKGIIRNVEYAVYPWSVDDISVCEASVPNISRVNNDTIYYRTIRDALADADRTETITLLKMVSLADCVYIGDEESHRYTVTIDLAGHTFGTTTSGTIGIASGSVAKFDNSSASRATIENLYMDTFGSGRIEFAESIDFAGALDLNNHRAVITGGRWNISEMGANPKLSIIGGKFNKDYSKYLAEGTQARFYKNTDEDQNTYRYIVDERHYTVSFDLQGHGEPQPATLSVIPMATISTPSAVSEEGYEFGGWFREPECANRWNFDTDPVESDMTLYAKWAKKNYNVYFNMNGHGEQIDTQSVPYGEMAKQPETPQEEGYTFGGWFRDRSFDNAWNFTTDPVKSNMTLHAKWDQNKYEVSFDMHGHGAQIASQSVAHGGKIAEPPIPSETGYLFDGWFKEDGTKSGSWGDQWNFENDTVTAAVTLHAKWSEAAAVVIDAQNTIYYRTAEEAFAAAQDKDTVKLLKPFEATEALTVNHSITLDLNGQTLSGNDDRYIISVENADFTVTDTSISKTGKIENTSVDPASYAIILTADDGGKKYKFTMTGGAVSGYNGVVTDWNYDTISISGGHISAAGKEYAASLSWWNNNVKLNITGGYFKGSVEYAGAGSMTSDGHITGGYYSDKSARSYMAKGYGVLDNTVEATKKEYPYMVGPAFRVEFELNGHGDTYYDVQYVANGGKVVKPEDPTEKGYTFDGWYTKKGMIDPETKGPDWGEPWNFETDTVTEDTILYAKWSTTFYTVTFDLHGHGGDIQPIGYPYGSKVVEPEKPYAEGWVFGGWFKEDGTESGNWGEKWNFEKDIVTAEITLHAKWDEAEASIISTRLTRPEYYTSLTAALASASDADTVTLYKTVEAASTIVIDKNITLDLNGRNISGSLTDCVIRVDGTSLKITDSTTGDTARGRIINNSTSGNSYAVALFGDETVKDDTLIETAAIDTLTIDGVAIEGYNAIWSDFNYDGIKMTSGSITARADGIIAGTDGIAAGFWNNCMKLEISGGEIKGKLSYEGAGGIADDYVGAITGGIYSDKPEKTFINPEYGVADNTSDTKYPYKVVKLSETSYEVTYDANGGTLDGPSSVTVQYGKTIGQDIRPKASFTDKVLGGWYAKVDEQTWSEEPWNFDTDVVTENLTLRAAWADALAEVSYTDAEGKPVVTQYAILSDAADKAAEIAIYPNAVLKLMTNVDIPAGEHTWSEFNDTADKKAELTLDLNGYDITGNTEDALLRILGNGHLILKDSTVTTGHIENSNASGDAISIADGSLTIASGYITGSRGAVYYDSSRNSSAKVAINGGKIKGAFSTGSLDTAHATITLNGGEYDRKSTGTYITLAENSDWIYRTSEDYPYAVVPDTDKVASYTWMTEGQGGEQIEHTEYFAAFEDAVAFANTKDTGDIELLKDYHKDTTYILYQDVTVYLNNHTLSGNAEKQALITAVGSNLAVSGGARVSAMTGTDRTDEKGSLSNTAASGIVISMSDPSKKLSIGSGRYQGSIVYENVQQGQKPAGDIYGGIYSEAPGKKEISGVISSEGYLKEGYEVTDNADDKYPKKVSIRKFTVTFNTLNKDVKVDPQHIEYRQKAKEETPYVKDLAFEGWFTANGSSSGDWGAKWSFDNEIKSDVELFAKWSHAVAALEHAGETKNYNSIADAVAAANAFTEGTAALTLLDNCDINATLAFDLKTGLTVDLKGKNLTGFIAGGSLISKSGSGKLTITDSADKTAYGLINNTGLRGGSISVGQGDAEIIAGKIRGAMSAAASQEKTGNITLAGGLYDSEAYASVNGTAVKLADGYVWLNRTEDGTYPYEVISGTELAATYTLNSRTVTFNSLESAVSYVNANAGGTLKLERDYPLSGQTAKALEFKVNVTLDLNGKSITVNVSAPAVKSEGKISILDSSSDKNGSINNSNGSALEVEYVDAVSKNIVISGGRFKGAVKYYGVPEPISELSDYKVGVTADIYGGAFSIDPTTVYATHVTAKVLREGYGVTDNGSDTYRYVVGINNYTVTFNGKGGTFTETGKTDNLIKNYKHGDTIGQQPEIKNSDNTKLFDGWFTKDGTIEKTSTGAPDWGKKWDFSTDKVVSNMTLYAKWGGRIAVIKRDGKELSFSSIQDAVDAARENETITVLGDVTAYEPIVITGKKLILDLGGHTITANPAGRLSGAVQITGGDVTVKNGKVINNAGTAVKTKDGTVVLSGLTVTSTAAAALSVDGGAMTVTGSTVTGTTGITVNPSASGSGAAKTVTLKVEGGSRITGTTNDGINSFKAEYGTPETGGKVDLKLNNSTINGKDCGIKMQGVDEFDCASEASTCVSEGDYAIDPGSARGDFNWKGGGLEAAKEIFVISGAVAITVSISAAFLKAKAMMSLKKAALIAGCTIAVAAITVGLFELLFNSGKGNKPKDEMVRIEYDSKGGSAVPEAFYVPKGTVITVEARPNKGNGSECKGWRCDANNLLYQGGESYTASKDTLFTAEYRYKVTFDTGNTDAKKITSKVPDAQWIDEGGKARKPVPSEYTPIDKNYVLSSWKDGNADFNFETTVINKPYNLKANWKDRASVKVTAKLKNDPTQLKVDWSRNYKTLYEALSEANKPYNEIAEKALEKVLKEISLDQVDISITVTLLDNFISSLNAQPVSGQLYETYDVKNDMTLNLANYDISEHLVNTAVFTVDSGSTLSVKGAGAIYSLKTAFKVNDDSSIQKGGGVNITAGAITAATNVISFNQYGAFSISGGTVEASGDTGNVVYVNNPQTGKITGGITGGYISGGTNIPKPASEEDKLNIAGGFYTEKAKTAFDNVGLPAGYCWKKSGLESHPWTIDRGRVVKFDAKGGTPAPEDQTVSIGERVIKPAAMTKEGCTFDAWYTKDGTVNKDSAGNPDWGVKWAFETRTIADTDPNPLWLYAKWDGAVARVDYHADVTGAVKNPTYHASVKTAFDTANADATAYQITLLKDAQIVTGEEAVAQKLDGITETKKYIFDLGEHTLSIGLTAESLRAAITVGQGIDITVKNGKINGTGRLVDNGAKLTLDGSISIKGITDDLIFEQNGSGSYTEFKSGTFTALKLEPSAGSITLTDGKYANIIYDPQNTSPVCSINGGVYDDFTKVYIEAKRALLYNIILNPYKPCWVTNTDVSTKYLYPWTLGDPVAYTSYDFDYKNSEGTAYHTSLKEAFEKASGDAKVRYIGLLKDITIKEEDGAVLKAANTEGYRLQLNGHKIIVDSPNSAAITVEGQDTGLTVIDDATSEGGTITGTGKLFSVKGGSLLLGCGADITGTENLSIVEESGNLTFNGAEYTNLTIEQKDGELICDYGTYKNVNLNASGGTATFEQGIIQGVLPGRYKNVIYEVVSGTPKLYVNGGIYDNNTKRNLECRSEVILNPQNPGWVPNPDEDTNEEYPWTLGKVVAVITKPGVEASEPKYYGTLQSAIDDSTAGETITLLASVSDADEGVAGYALKAGTTLDLDGHDITTQALISNDAELKDSKESAMIRVSTISQLTVKSSNTQLPVYDNVKGGYRLFNYSFKALGVKHAKPSEGMTYHDYQLKFTTASAKEDGYRILAQGNHGLELVIKAKYKDKNDDIKQIDVAFVSERKDMIKDYGEQMLIKESKVFRATYRAGKELPYDRTITSIAVFASSCGIQLDTENNPKTSRFYTQQQVSN